MLRSVARSAPMPLLLAGAVCLAPAPTAGAPPAFTGETSVVEVAVPVNVTDRDGQPVRGLSRESFTVLDRGRPREIVSFEVVDLAVEVPERMTERAIEAAVPAAARRHFLLLFDLSFSNPSSILRARQAARDFILTELHPTDLVAVATYSLEHGARLLITFTPDRAQVARAVDTLGARSLTKDGQTDPLRFLIEPYDVVRDSASETLGSGSAGSIKQQLEAEVAAYLNIIATQMDRQEKSFARGRIASWTRGLEEMAKALASVEGRKHVVYFSEGFDGRLMLGRAPDGFDPQTGQDQLYLQQGQYWMVDPDDIYGNSALQNDASQMLSAFRRADAVIQAVDIAGLRVDGAEARRARSVGQDVLFFVAHETGGELYADANDLGAQLGSVISRSEVTYLLTIRADDVPNDGSYHPLEVQVAAPEKVRLSHREGYFAPRPFDDLHPLEKALLASDAIAAAEPIRDVGVDVLAAPFRASAELAYVPVIVEIDGGTLLVGHQGKQLQAEIYVYVSNARAEMKDFFTQVVTLDLEAGREALQQAGLKYYGHLMLDPGRYLVRVLVRNATTGRTGVQTASLEVPAYESDEPDLLPPFFVEPPGRWVLVREQPRDGQKSVVYPFTVNGQPFIPAARPGLGAEEAWSVCLVAYNLGDGEIAVDGTILAEDGRPVDVTTLSGVERTLTGISGLDKLLARFHPAGLARGQYTLQVKVTNVDRGISESSEIPFIVN